MSGASEPFELPDLGGEVTKQLVEQLRPFPGGKGDEVVIHESAYLLALGVLGSVARPEPLSGELFVEFHHGVDDYEMSIDIRVRKLEGIVVSCSAAVFRSFLMELYRIGHIANLEFDEYSSRVNVKPSVWRLLRKFDWEETSAPA